MPANLRCLSAATLLYALVAFAADGVVAADDPQEQSTPSVAAGDAQQLPEIGTAVGQMYPDFLLPRVDGGLLRLSDYRGKKVLLLHFASW